MMAKAHRGNNTSCNGNYQTGSSTGIIEIAVDEVEDDHEVEDFVLHVFGFQKLYGHHMHGTAGCLQNGVSKAWRDLTDVVQARHHCQVV